MLYCSTIKSYDKCINTALKNVNTERLKLSNSAIVNYLEDSNHSGEK